MERTKLTVRVPKQFLDGAKQYAAEHDTTVTRLITEYLRRLDIESDIFEDAPIVRRLAGTLPPMMQVMRDIGGVEIPETFAKLAGNEDEPTKTKSSRVPAASPGQSVPPASDTPPATELA